MEKSGERSLLGIINEKARKVRRSRYSIPIYILTVFFASIWLILINPCLMNILLPILAILVPYKLYDENSLKKLLVVGITAIILLAFTMGSYHVGILYDQPARQLRSGPGALQNGTIDRIYGDSNTEFRFTVEVNLTKVGAAREDITLYANISYAEAEGIRREDYEGYEMSPVNDNDDENDIMKYEVVVSGLPERLFNHYFSLRKDVPIEEGDFSWERTSLGFGPVTLERRTALGMITLQQSFSTSVIFLLGVGLLWLKKRMDKSIVESTEGLEEKEEGLEDYCPDCGHLLEGKKECDRCGWIKEPEDEMYDDEGEPG